MAALASSRAKLDKGYFFALQVALKRFRRCKNTESAVEFEIGHRTMKFSTGKMAKLANGAVVAEHGENSTLVTAVSEKNSTDTNRRGLPLLVDYKEKAAAGGQIPRNFFRKDARMSDRETLVSRRMDRSLRSLFPKSYSCNTQVTSSLWAADGLHDPDIAAINGASAALAVSDIPWSGPVGAVRVGEIDGKLVINPTWSELDSSKLNLVIACSEKKVVMVEAFAQEVSSERFCEALRFGFNECQPIIKALRELQSQAGKEKRTCEVLDIPVEVLDAVKRHSVEQLGKIFSNFTYSKMERDREMFAVNDSCFASIQEQFPHIAAHLIHDAIFEVTRSVFRQNVLEKAQRCDGRPLDALRPIKCEVDLFKSLHGSSLFQRGETQVFCTATLGSRRSARQRDVAEVAVGDVREKPFMLHYEFPPFCVKEIGFSSGYSRREIGHGNLAEMALEPVVPKDFPFAIRLTSQVLESNGSSSLASVCAGSLTLMDAGVPITRPVGGVACGLITSSDAEDPDKQDIDQYRLLTDILGIEDYMGDMDFKLAGSRQGITALQADFKVPGLPLYIVEEAVTKATDDRMKVLDIIEECQSDARRTPKDNAPAVVNVSVPRHHVKRLLGSGAKVLKNLEEETGTDINRIEEDQFSVFAPNAKALKEAVDRINEITTIKSWTDALEVGSTYTTKVVDVRDYGVMVEILPNAPSVLLHYSEMSHGKGNNPSKKLTKGEIVDVVYIGKDELTGRPRISTKSLATKTRDSMDIDEFVATYLK